LISNSNRHYLFQSNLCFMSESLPSKFLGPSGVTPSIEDVERLRLEVEKKAREKAARKEEKKKKREEKTKREEERRQAELAEKAELEKKVREEAEKLARQWRELNETSSESEEDDEKRQEATEERSTMSVSSEDEESGAKVSVRISLFYLALTLFFRI
jgi:DNA repair exonuclease SbcCD ATPase subunit